MSILGETPIWTKKDDYDWSCFSGCPPGFDCSGDEIEPCPYGASDLNTEQCSTCPTGLVCKPGRIPRPCSLGQFVTTEMNGDTIMFAGKEFNVMTKYTCNDPFF